ncbi:MAG TPA: L,D-transpeptidase [archaeon]|nr:L,D-transpeptidase [archaeon]
MLITLLLGQRVDISIAVDTESMSFEISTRENEQIDPIEEIESVALPEITQFEALSKEIKPVAKFVPDPERYLGHPEPEPYEDASLYNGWYYESNNKWIPGMLTFDVQYLLMPDLFTGSAVPYGPGVMEATAEYNELSLEGMMDGVALMTCADHGALVWLKRPGNEWEGPFRVVDCAARKDLYNVVVHNGESVEIGFETARRWGMANLDENNKWDRHWNVTRIDNVMVSKIPPSEIIKDVPVVDLREWFLDRIEFDPFETNEEATEYYVNVPRMLYRPPTEENGKPSWRIPPNPEFVQFDINTTRIDGEPSEDATNIEFPGTITIQTPTSVNKGFVVGLDEIWLEVDLSDQTLTVNRGKDKLNTFSVSTGLPRTPTPLGGSYKIYAMYENYTMQGETRAFPNTPWVIFFHGEYAIHGTYWHDNFGTPMSRGCVNMAINEAKIVFDLVQNGTHVFIHE